MRPGSEKTMIDLVPMNDDEFEEYLKAAVQKYAKEKVESGSWKEEESLELSNREFKRHLPNGIATKGHYLFNLKDKNTNRNVGMIWVGLKNPDNREDGAWIWDFIVNESERGRGFGKDALIALDRFLGNIGQNKVSLHVFGHNEIAINLYKKSGYRITDLVMSKDIKPK